MQVEQQIGNPPSADKVPRRAEGESDIQAIAQVQQDPDEEDAQWTARPIVRGQEVKIVRPFYEKEK